MLRRLLMIYLAVALVAWLWKVLIFGRDVASGHVIATIEIANNFMVFYKEDIPVAAFLLTVMVALSLVPSRLSEGCGTWIAGLLDQGYWPRAIWWLAAGTFVLTYAGRVIAHHGYDFVGDEYIPWFQSQIFLAGQLTAEVDPAFGAAGTALQPIFTILDESRGLWIGAYRPGYALLRTAATLLGDDGLLNPLLASGSVLLIARLAMQVLPDRPGAPVLAATLLVATPQFTVMATSGFSFTAHLFFALLWLTCFLRADLRGHVAAALVAAFALGLHQVHVQLLIAAPFLLAHLLGHYGRSLASLAVYAVVYPTAALAWMAWPEIAIALHTSDLSVLPSSIWDLMYLRGYAAFSEENGELMGLSSAPEMSANLLRFAAWLSPALLGLVLVALGDWRQLPLTVRLCAVGVVLMIAAHAVLMPFQVHAWGYRYAHPVVGYLVLVGVAGLPARGVERPRLLAATVALLGVSLFVLTPWRFTQVSERIAPRAAAARYIANIDADAVLVDRRGIWFGIDFVRNDPFLRNRPLILNGTGLPPAAEAALVGLRVVHVGPEDLKRFGLSQGTWYEPVRAVPGRP